MKIKLIIIGIITLIIASILGFLLIFPVYSNYKKTIINEIDNGTLYSNDKLKMYRPPVSKSNRNFQANLEWKSDLNDKWISGNQGAGGNAHIEIIN